MSLHVCKRHKHTEMLSRIKVSSLEKDADLYPISLHVGRNVLLLTVCQEWLLNKFLLIHIWCRSSSVIGEKCWCLLFCILPTWG